MGSVAMCFGQAESAVYIDDQIVGIRIMNGGCERRLWGKGVSRASFRHCRSHETGGLPARTLGQWELEAEC